MSPNLTQGHLTSSEMEKCPYERGKALTLHLGKEYNGRLATAQVIRTFEPFTFSCVMLVFLQSEIPHLNGEMVLKLFDRRFAAAHRKGAGALPWSMKIENEFQDFVQNGSAAAFYKEIDWKSEIDGESWSDVQNETFLACQMGIYQVTEIDAYRRLESLQGTEIPRFLTSATLRFPDVRSDLLGEYTDISGLLISFSEGFSLEDLQTNAPRELGQTIGDEALRMIWTIIDLGVLNEDIRCGNFLVNPNNCYNVQMVDFAMCVFREQHENEHDWKTSQAVTGSESTLANILRFHTNLGFVWQPSTRYRELNYLRPWVPKET